VKPYLLPFDALVTANVVGNSIDVSRMLIIVNK
jgi:hypothetical protein